jgi:hypothetical protein
MLSASAPFSDLRRRRAAARPQALTASYHRTMWMTVEGIAVTLSDLIAGVSGWLAAKVRGEDLFDQVVGEAERERASPDLRESN